MISVLTITLFAIFLYLSWRDLRYGIYLLILTLPLNNRFMFALDHPQLLPVRVALGALFISFVVKFLLDLRGESLRSLLKSAVDHLKTDSILWVMTLLLVVRIVSVKNSLDLASSASFLAFFSAMYLLYIIVKYLYLEYGERFVLKSFNFHVLVVMATGVFSIFQLVLFNFQDRVLPGVWPSTTEPTRFGSTFWDINHYAPYIMTVLPFLLLKFIYAENLKGKLLYFGGFAFSNVILLMTFSRSGWLGYAFGLFVLGVLLLLKRMKKGLAYYSATLAAMLIVVSVGVAYFNLPVLERLKTLSRNVYNQSYHAHALINKGHFEIFEKNPVLGGGYGSFNAHFRETSYAKEYFDLDPVEEVRLPAHSIWLEPLSETGAVGFFVFASLLFLTLRGLYTAFGKVKDVNLQVINGGVFAGISAVLFSGLFYSYNLEYIWLFIFLAVFIYRSAITRQEFSFWNYSSVLTVLGLSTWAIFPRLGEIALIDWDESIYAEVSKNILRYADVITLRWERGELWFEKPPLYFWLTAFMYMVYEISEFSARFWSAFSGFLGAVVVYLMGRDMFDKFIGLASALTLLSTVHWIFQSRNGTLDVMVAALSLLTLYFFYKAREHPRYWWLTGAVLGLTLMTKGVVFIVPLGVMISFALLERFLYREGEGYTLKGIAKAVLSFFVVVLPWHIVSYLLHGREFVDSYLIYHVFQRTQGIEGHSNELLWYITVIKVWARHNFILLILALFYFGYQFLRSYKERLLPDKRYVFLLLWAGVTFVIFSLSTSKIQWYIMPIYPAASLIIGVALMKVGERVPYLRYVLIAILIMGVPFFKNQYSPLWDIDDYNRGVAEVAEHVPLVARDDPEEELMIVNLSPGPAMYYSDWPAVTANFDGLVNAAESGEEFYAIARTSDARKLLERFPDRGIEVFAKDEEEDFALLGRQK